MPHYTVIENVDGFTLMCLREGNWEKNGRKFHGAHFHKSEGWTKKLVEDALSILRLS